MLAIHVNNIVVIGRCGQHLAKADIRNLPFIKQVMGTMVNFNKLVTVLASVEYATCV